MSSSSSMDPDPDPIEAAGYTRHAWTGGDTPPPGERRHNPAFRRLVSLFFREQLRECGGLDLWACAGTSALERARIFWNRARLDGWRTLQASSSGRE